MHQIVTIAQDGQEIRYWYDATNAAMYSRVRKLERAKGVIEKMTHIYGGYATRTPGVFVLLGIGTFAATLSLNAFVGGLAVMCAIALYFAGHFATLFLAKKVYRAQRSILLELQEEGILINVTSATYQKLRQIVYRLLCTGYREKDFDLTGYPAEVLAAHLPQYARLCRVDQVMLNRYPHSRHPVEHIEQHARDAAPALVASIRRHDPSV